MNIEQKLANVAANIGSTAGLVQELAVNYSQSEPGSNFTDVGLQMAIQQLQSWTRELKQILDAERAITPSTPNITT